MPGHAYFNLFLMEILYYFDGVMESRNVTEFLQTQKAVQCVRLNRTKSPQNAQKRSYSCEKWCEISFKKVLKYTPLRGVTP